MTDPFRPLKNAFGRFATGVALAGCRDVDGAPILLTVNSFTSVSLAPPLVLWCIEKKASTFNAFMTADAYSINILKAGQRAMSDRFAQHLPAPLQPHEYETWETGAPILKERLAAFDCRVSDRHDAGDHVVLIAEVVKFTAGEGAPLLYFASRYAEGPEAEQ
jgi:flavin reductase (DIM6/NTAB) family NADH-FMN oxidoreductase RutF